MVKHLIVACALIALVAGIAWLRISLYRECRASGHSTFYCVWR